MLQDEQFVIPVQIRQEKGHYSQINAEESGFKLILLFFSNKK